MTAISPFKEPSDLAEKLFREAGRLHKSSSEKEAADHFFNFCVTSISLRDWFFNYQNIPIDHETWRSNADGLFGVCADIANAAKHLKFKKNQPTAKAEKINLIAISSSGLIDGLTKLRPTFILLTSDGSEIDQFKFITNVCEAWGILLKKHMGYYLPPLIDYLVED